MITLPANPRQTCAHCHETAATFHTVSNDTQNRRFHFCPQDACKAAGQALAARNGWRFLTRWASVEAAADHLRRTNGGQPDWVDRVARRMYDGQHSVWHAAWEDRVEGFDTGRIPTVPCPHCGGRADPRIGFHNMCAVRVELGQTEIRPLDVGAVLCDCAPCSRDRGER